MRKTAIIGAGHTPTAAMFAGSATAPSFRGSNYSMGGYNPIFIPRRGKFKGYMRENRRNSFNKTK